MPIDTGKQISIVANDEALENQQEIMYGGEQEGK